MTLVMRLLLPCLALIAAAHGGEAPDYQKQIVPLLEANCVSCHGATKQKGGLRLDSRAAIEKGGKGGAVVIAGHPEQSPLYGRVVLPEDHEDIMPAKGDPLAQADRELLRAWIAGGASFGDEAAPADKADAATTAPVAPESAQTVDTDLDRLAAALPAPDAAAIAALARRGARIVALSANGALLDVDCSHAQPFSDADAAALRALGAHVAWLDLGGTAVTSGQLELVTALPNLSRLHLERTAVSDASLRHLQQCPRLEYLNLVDVPVGDDGLARLTGLRALRTVCVGGTMATDAGIAALTAAVPGVTVERAAALAPLPSDGEDKPRKRKKKQ
ncbi:MAG TPA: c-type cytochrome domain-containing protein [Planctomycetota bacterium]|nr:c-type cytochrome domain-containing protein [Planctomycetota bacterium]